MRYWVYINDKVVGPYEEEKLGEINGLSPDTLICMETVDPGKTQEWVKASSVFDFNDVATDNTSATITGGQLTPQDAQGNPFQTQFGASNEDELRKQLLEKIDRLTQEIEGMKGKLDEAIAASNAAQEAAAQQFSAFAAKQPATDIASTSPETNTSLPTTTATDNDPITNTVNLINHAEEVVLQTQQTTEDKKPVDFLDEIHIGENKDNLTEKSSGEEVVLRSALDSLYNVQEPPEEEKEATFQDLLSPIKLDTNESEQQQAPAEEPKPEEEKPTEEPVEEEPSAESPVAQEAVQPEPEQITEEKREEIINEITAPEAQPDLIAQAIEEIEKDQAQPTEEPVVEEPEPVKTEPEVAETPAEPAIEETPAEEEQPAVEESVSTEEPAEAEQNQEEEPAVEPAPAEVPDLEISPVVIEHNENEPIVELDNSEKEEISMEVMPADKEPLDLEDQPQLEVHKTSEPEAVQELQDIEQQEPVAADDLTPMDPEEGSAQQEKEEANATAQELIPGKELAESDEILSQQDLDEAFVNRETSSQIMDGPEISTVQQTLPDSSEYYNPKEMTEIQLKEGSTYLISDFVPPAETGNKEEPAVQDVLGSPLMQEPQPEEKGTESIEEIVPQQHKFNDPTKTAADLSMSKVVLENTIKTKRGATMDIKTVPMVKEPGNSERLDLSDSDLDLSAQHDLKAADITPSSNRLLKGIFGLLIAFVLLVLLYGMLAYLEFIPAKYNILKSSSQEADITEEMGEQPSAQQVSLQTEDDDEDFSTDPTAAVLAEVKNYMLVNGSTLEQLINSRHPAAKGAIEWNISQAVDPDNYSILVKIPPENAQSFKISYRFNYNMLTKALDPTISDSKNLLDSVQAN